MLIARQPEVEDADPAVAPHHDVGRLEVAVHQLRAVRGGQRAGGVAEDAQDLADGARLLLDPGLDRAPVDELHGDEDAVAEAADVVDGDDVGVADAGQRLGLAQQAQPGDLGILVGVLRLQQLDGDRPVQLGIARAIDDAHAAAGDAALDDVAADRLAGLDDRRGAGLADEHASHRRARRGIDGMLIVFHRG